MVFNKYIDLFALNQVSQNTANVYRQELTRFFGFFQNGHSNIQLHDILQYRNSQKDLHPITVAWKMSVIRSFFSFLVQQQVINHNPTIAVKSPRVKRHPNFPTFGLKQFKSLINNLRKDTFRGFRDFCILMCMGRLGMRVSEVCGLSHASFDDDLDQPTFLIFGKGNAIRTVPILDKFEKELHHYLKFYPFAIHGNYPLFPATAKTLKPITPRAIQMIIKRNCEAVGIKQNITPHTLRHFALSRLLKEGQNIFTIQTFAGHSQLATTARYLHQLEKQKDYTMNIVRKKSLMRKTKPQQIKLEVAL